MANRIIEPLTSRCSKFRFKPLSVDVLKSRLEHIVTAEDMSCDKAVIDAVISASQGDLRKAITLLQSASHLKGPNDITDQDITEIAGVSHYSRKSGIRIQVVSSPTGGLTPLSGGISAPIPRTPYRWHHCTHTPYKWHHRTHTPYGWHYRTHTFYRWHHPSTGGITAPIP